MSLLQNPDYLNLFQVFKKQTKHLELKYVCMGAPGWLSQLSGALGSGHDLRVLGLSPKSGSWLSREPDVGLDPWTPGS